VVIPFRGEEKSYIHMKVMGDIGQLVPMRWDIRDKDSIRRAAQHSNLIINLVGQKYATRNFSLHDVNVEGAKRIAEVAKELKVDKFIHVSALSASTTAESEFLKTKAEGEIAVKSIFPDVTIIRPADFFGAQDQFLHHHSSMMRYWPFYPLVHPNKQVQPVWVNDVATAIINSLKTSTSIGQTYEVGGPQIYTVRQVAEWINMVLKLKARIVEVPDEFVWHMGYWLGQHRKPRYTLESIKQSQDNVCSGKFPGLLQLNVNATGFTSQLSIGYILHYRQPIRMMDITLEQEELPEGIEAGKPAY